MYYEAMLPQEEMLPPLPVQQRLSPFLLNYMKKDPAFASEVQANLKNYENIAKMKARRLMKT
jgi:hypothetical protein